VRVTPRHPAAQFGRFSQSIERTSEQPAQQRDNVSESHADCLLGCDPRAFPAFFVGEPPGVADPHRLAVYGGGGVTGDPAAATCQGLETTVKKRPKMGQIMSKIFVIS
jgi:hypothetical protein